MIGTIPLARATAAFLRQLDTVVEASGSLGSSTCRKLLIRLGCGAMLSLLRKKSWASLLFALLAAMPLLHGAGAHDRVTQEVHWVFSDSGTAHDEAVAEPCSTCLARGSSIAQCASDPGLAVNFEATAVAQNRGRPLATDHYRRAGGGPRAPPALLI
ncbi:MAG: hypothetical protein P8M78_09070 [Myxococcota bacterium]|nr:hypothetical protein [Myxococcota bacterium]